MVFTKRNNKMKNIYKILSLTLLTFLIFTACEEFENTFQYQEFVQFSSNTASLDEDATAPIEVSVQLVGAQRSSAVDVTVSVTENNAAEGVDYSFPGGKTFTIAPNSSTASIQIAAIDNAEIFTGSRSITLTITDASGLGLNGENASNVSVTVTLNEDDFFCPRNDLAKVVTSELDLGYSSSDVSIELVTSPDGCYAFEVLGGTGSIFSTTDVKFGPIELVEDGPESATGTISDASFGLVDLNGDALNGGSGNQFVLEITNGTYDLSTGTFQVDYVLFEGTSPLFPGTLIYN